MATQEQLRKEIRMLREQKHNALKKLRTVVESKRDMADIGLRRKRELLMSKRERKRLMQELKELNNPRSTSFKRNLKRGLRIGGKASGKGLKRLWDAIPSA